MRAIVRNIGLALIAVSFLTVEASFVLEARFGLGGYGLLLAMVWTITGLSGITLYLIGRERKTRRRGS